MSFRPGAGGRAYPKGTWQVSSLQATAPANATRPADTSAVGELPDGELTARRDAPLGGQAVLEGVMMRGVRHWAVAVRKPLRPDADRRSRAGSHDDESRSDESRDTPLQSDESQDGKPSNLHDVSHSLEVAFEREGELGREEEEGKLEAAR